MTIKKRNRRKHDLTFDERLHRAAEASRDAASKLPDGPEREMLLKKASQAESAVQINDWLSGPASPPPSAGRGGGE
jgi:hypothetical protein